MPAPAANAQHLGTLADGRQLLRLSCAAEVEEVEGAQWVHVLPAGPFVLAVDGRSFVLSDAAKVVMTSEPPLLVDWEHSSEMWRGSTRAAGWIEELAVEAGNGKFKRPGVWGRVDWTPAGKKDVDDKSYRFLSPVVLLDPDTRDALEIASVALTNCPALQMEGLQSYRERLSARFGQLHNGEQRMKPESFKLLLAALALTGESFTDEQVIEAAKKLEADRKADREMCAALSKQLGEANAKVAELEANAKAAAEKSEKDAFAAEVKACIEGAIRDGKVTPATRAGFEAMCKDRASFATFKDVVLPSLPVIGAPAPRTTPAPTPAAADTKVRTVLRAKGFTDEQIAKAEALKANGHETDDEED